MSRLQITIITSDDPSNIYFDPLELQDLAREFAKDPLSLGEFLFGVEDIVVDLKEIT